MAQIPADILKEVLALRGENGLEATEEAVMADLARAKAKWTLEDTPRYRRAGRSPIHVSGKYLTAAGVCPATGEPDGKVRKPGRPKAAAGGGAPVEKSSTSVVDERVFYKVLHGRGFTVKICENLLTGEIETQIPVAISKLGLQFGAIGANASDIHVIQTSPQIQIAMPLDKFLEVTGIRP